MKKILLAVLCVALAAPAFALDTQLNGFFRTKMYATNLSHFAKDQNTNKFVDQRFRAKATLNMNEYVSVVYYGEIDFVYGDASYGSGVARVTDVDGKTQVIRKSNRNTGGGIGADTVNLETKNLYATLKLPETPMGVTVGLQGYFDNFSGVVFIADMAGVKVAGKAGPVSGNVGWFKWQEGKFNEEDDVDLYAAQLAFVPMDKLTVGLDAYWMNINGTFDGNTSLAYQPVIAAALKAEGASINNGDLYFVGPQVSYKMDNMNFSGWLLYEGGTVTVDSTAGSDDVDISSWAAAVKANFSVAGAALGAQAMWFQDAGNDEDKWKGLFIPTTGELGPFGDSGMMIFFGDVYTTTFGPEGDLNGWAMDDAVYSGYGLYGLVVNGSYSPPAMKDLYIKAAVGYFSAVDDTVMDTAEREGKSLGVEGTLRVGIKIAKAADFSLNGAAASLGSFYDKTAKGDDPDDPWMTYAMLNVNY